MKQFLKEFLFRGCLAAAGGPLVLAIIYGILGATGAVTVITPAEVSTGILTLTFLAFVVAGMTAIYQLEQLPLISAILIHGAGLYGAYIVTYLLNGWLQPQLTAVLVFTGIFVACYGLIWLGIYTVSKKKIEKMNRKLHKKT